MARSAKRGAAASGGGGARGARREPRATSKKVAVPVAEVEVVEEEKGLGIDDGIILVTTVLLVVSFFLADYILGAHYGKGLFFGG